MSEKRSGQRWLSCLKAEVQTSVGSAVDCYIRDFSSEGARLEISAGAVLPDNIHLYFPLKQATFRARVRWRRANEIGVVFEAPEMTPRAIRCKRSSSSASSAWRPRTWSCGWNPISCAFSSSGLRPGMSSASNPPLIVNRALAASS
jgi:hypothetical protein